MLCRESGLFGRRCTLAGLELLLEGALVGRERICEDLGGSRGGCVGVGGRDGVRVGRLAGGCV